MDIIGDGMDSSWQRKQQKNPKKENEILIPFIVSMIVLALTS